MTQKDNSILPNPLTTIAGTPVDSSQAWLHMRRMEILDLFREYVYGRTPEFSGEISFDVFDEDNNALDGTAVRKQIMIQVITDKGKLNIDLLIFLPIEAESHPVPVFQPAELRRKPYCPSRSSYFFTKKPPRTSNASG